MIVPDLGKHNDNVIGDQPSQVHITELTQPIDIEKAILKTLREQNELLVNISNLLARSSEIEKEKINHIRSRIVDIDMPIGSMVGFIFKWLIALIPIGIILGIFSLILGGCQ